MNLASIPLVDNHCHSLLRQQPQTVAEWRNFFTESYYAEIAQEHVEHTVFYQWAQRELGALYACAPDAQAILEKRAAFQLPALVQRINHAANIDAWLVDYGYSTAETFGQAELESIAGVRVAGILRLEPLIEQLIIHSATFDALLDAYRAALQDLRAQGYVSLKSIIAYRVGLQLGEPDLDAAKRAFGTLQERARREGRLRVDNKPLLDLLIPLAVERAAAQEFPIQFHTGFGDPDQDLARVNPAFLRPLFEHEKYRGAKIVLLHASYPYARTLGYLAAVYPNVYADFGLAIPFVTGEARQILRELLGLAPASKVLYSSDAFHIPELYYLGARLGRRALGQVLDEFVSEGLCDSDSAQRMAEMILHANARRVYELT